MADTTDIGGIAVKGLLVKWFAIFMTGGLIYYFFGDSSQALFALLHDPVRGYGYTAVWWT